MIRKSLLCGAAVLAFTASARAAIVFSDSFSYPNGPLDNSSTNTTSPYVNASGPTGQIQVTSGQVTLMAGTASGTEGVGAAFPGGVIASGTVYAGYDVNFSSLPVATTFNDYFTAFRNTNKGISARGRIFAVPATDGTSTFQIGVTDNQSTTTSATNPVALIPTDLSLNTTYRIVEAYNIGGRTTVYVNPVAETGGTTSVDTAASSLSIGAFSLLNTPGVGTTQLDNLVVATTFSEAASVPEPTSLSLIGLAGLGLLRRRRA